MPITVNHIFTSPIADGTNTQIVSGESCLNYNKNTGVFTWIKLPKACHIKKIGDIAGNDDDGYTKIVFDGKKYRAHRLAFYAIYGYFPKQIDHKNGIRSDNRICNLIAADYSINAKNHKRRKDSLTAFTGVTYSKRHNKWKVRINDNGETIYLGLFEDKEEAINTRLHHQKLLGYSERHGV